MTLCERCKSFMSVLGVPTTTFCRKISISKTAFYRWRDGDLKLSDETLRRITNYIEQYGF